MDITYFVNDRPPAESAESKDFAYLTEWQGLGFSQNHRIISRFPACCSTLYAKHKTQMQSPVFSPFCKSAVVQPFRALAAMPASIACTTVTRAPAFPPLPRSKSILHNTHRENCLWAWSANRMRDSVHIKNNPSGPQRTLWDWRVCQASRKQGMAMSRSPVRNLAQHRTGAVWQCQRHCPALWGSRTLLQSYHNS